MRASGLAGRQRGHIRSIGGAGGQKSGNGNGASGALERRHDLFPLDELLMPNVIRSDTFHKT
jgi:hypothetical protein